MTEPQTPTPPQAESVNTALGDTRKTRRFATLLAVVGLCVVAIAAGLWVQREQVAAPTPPQDVSLQDPATLVPALKVDAAEALATMEFTTLDGEKVTLADLKGQPILLNFWASWCPPCVKEMGKLDDIAKDYADHGLVVIVASLDTTTAEARDFLIKNRYGHVRPVMDMGGAQFMRLKNANLPVTLLVKADGTLAERIDGFRYWDAAPMLEKIRNLLPKA